MPLYCYFSPDQSAAGNPSGLPPAHSNNTTPDSGTSLSPGIDAMDGRGQVEVRDQREGPPSLFWSYDSSRPATALFHSPGSARRRPAEKLTPKPRIHPPQLQILQQHRDPLPSRHQENHVHENQCSPLHQTPPLRHRKPTFPASLTIKDGNFNSHQSAFSPTKPHFPMSPLQRRPPINPTSVPSAQTLPHYQQSFPGKPAFQRSMTLPHSYPAPALKMFSSGISDDEEEEEEDERGREGGQLGSCVLTTLPGNSPITTSKNLAASNSSTNLSPSAASNLQIESTSTSASEPSLLLHVRDKTRYLYNQLSRAGLMGVFADIGSTHCNIQKLE